MLGRRWWVSLGALLAGVAILVGYFYAAPMKDSSEQFKKALSQLNGYPLRPEDTQSWMQLFREQGQLKWAALAVEKLLRDGKATEASRLAEKPIAYIKQDLPFHGTFAEVSILIEKRELQMALLKSQELKESLGGQKQTFAYLYGANLLRIAFLEKALMNVEAEKVAWLELDRFLKSSEGKEVAASLSQSFSQSGTSLERFLEAKKGQGL
jgi:hypothetical protein